MVYLLQAGHQPELLSTWSLMLFSPRPCILQDRVGCYAAASPPTSLKVWTWSSLHPSSVSQRKTRIPPPLAFYPASCSAKSSLTSPRAPGFSARKQNRDGSPIGPVLRKDIAEVDRYLATHQLNRRLTQALEVAASWGRDVLLAGERGCVARYPVSWEVQAKLFRDRSRLPARVFGVGREVSRCGAGE